VLTVYPGESWAPRLLAHEFAKRGLAIACRPSVCLSVRQSVTLMICDHIGWKSWKLIPQTITPTSSLFVAKRRFFTPRGTLGNFRETRTTGIE